jgi:hypothetical protein
VSYLSLHIIEIFFKAFFYRVGEALIFGSWMLGQALAYAPNVNAAILSASKIMKLLEKKPNMNNPQPLAGVNYDV